MEVTKLVGKIHMECPLCGRTHEIEERKRKTQTSIKGEEGTYEERFYFCAKAHNTFPLC